MKSKLFAKITVDISMTAALLLLMTFELIGAEAHEWLGIGTDQQHLKSRVRKQNIQKYFGI